MTMTREDITQEDYQKLRAAFDADPKIQTLKQKQVEYASKRNYALAVKVGANLKTLWDKVLDNYVESFNRVTNTQIKLSECGLSQDDTNKLAEIVLAMFMCCDIIETCNIEANDILHKKDKSLHFEMFDDVRDLCKAVKTKLGFLQHETSYMKDLLWANSSDKMYEMLIHKTRAIIKKRGTDQWSKNWEEL